MLKLLGLFELEKGRKTEGNLLVFINDKEDGDILLSIVFSKSRRDNGQKLKYNKCYLNIRKNIFLFWECQTGCSESLCSLCGGIQDPTAYSHEQPALAGAILARCLDYAGSRDPSNLNFSVILYLYLFYSEHYEFHHTVARFLALISTTAAFGNQFCHDCLFVGFFSPLLHKQFLSISLQLIVAVHFKFQCSIPSCSYAVWQPPQWNSCKKVPSQINLSYSTKIILCDIL